MRQRVPDPGLVRAARTGLLVGLWVTGLAMVAYLFLGGAQMGLDSHAYWLASQVEHPYGAEPHAIDAFLYSPLFLQVFRPLGLDPLARVRHPVGRDPGQRRLVAVAPTRSGLEDPSLAAVCSRVRSRKRARIIGSSLVLGFARPGWWALLPLTKVAPAAPVVLWLMVRGEWRRLASFAAWTVALVTVSVLVSPTQWAEWLAFLTRPRDLDLAMWVRLAMSAVVVVMAARRGWVWALPLAVLLAIPTDGLGVSGIVIMTTVPRLLAMSRSTRADGTARHGLSPPCRAGPYAEVMSDATIRQRISNLVDEEHDLRRRLSSHEISPADEHARLRQVETELDQCWDLLRQREAKREFGQDPETAEVRDARIVEGYQG